MGERLGDALKGFLGKKEDEEPIPPEKCPWCGKDMEWGYIDGGRDYSVMWRNWRPRGLLGIFQPEDAREIDLLVERAAKLLSMSVNRALHPSYSTEEMELLL